MKCFRSFTFVSRDNGSFGGGDIDTWTIGLQNFWAVTKLGTSTFFIEGFKNVDIYSIEAVGDVFCDLGTGNSVIVNNWAFTVQINGKVPLISGFKNSSPNDFALQNPDSTPFIQLGRFISKLEYSDPVRSVTSIQIGILRASGIGNESLTDINLNWNVAFTVKYLYEGEDDEFAFL